jgi:hypothetical protein
MENNEIKNSRHDEQIKLVVSENMPDPSLDLNC